MSPKFIPPVVDMQIKEGNLTDVTVDDDEADDQDPLWVLGVTEEGIIICEGLVRHNEFVNGMAEAKVASKLSGRNLSDHGKLCWYFYSDKKNSGHRHGVTAREKRNNYLKYLERHPEVMFLTIYEVGCESEFKCMEPSEKHRPGYGTNLMSQDMAKFLKYARGTAFEGDIFMNCLRDNVDHYGRKITIDFDYKESAGDEEELKDCESFQIKFIDEAGNKNEACERTYISNTLFGSECSHVKEDVVRMVALRKANLMCTDTEFEAAKWFADTDPDEGTEDDIPVYYTMYKEVPGKGKIVVYVYFPDNYYDRFRCDD